MVLVYGWKLRIKFKYTSVETFIIMFIVPDGLFKEVEIVMKQQKYKNTRKHQQWKIYLSQFECCIFVLKTYFYKTKKNRFLIYKAKIFVLSRIQSLFRIWRFTEQQQMLSSSFLRKHTKWMYILMLCYILNIHYQ